MELIGHTKTRDECLLKVLKEHPASTGVGWGEKSKRCHIYRGDRFVEMKGGYWACLFNGKNVCNDISIILLFKKTFFATFRLFLLSVISDKEWCCGTLKQYPDLVPNISWGSLVDVKKRKIWTERDCNTVIGGEGKSKCPGINSHTQCPLAIIRSNSYNFNLLN